MKLPLLFASRYLFAKKSTNAIHIITGISVLGVSIGTAALILVLSVFNGFEDLLSGLFGHFNPQIKITATTGKVFDIDSAGLQRLRQLEGVGPISTCLEEIAFFQYNEAQEFGILKGVDAHFAAINQIDSTIREGTYLLEESGRNYAVVGAGVRNKLSVDVENFAAPLRVYMPLNQNVGLLDQPFKTRILYPQGTFSIQQDYDNQYILTNISFVRELLDAGPNTVSSVEIRCKNSASPAVVKQKIKAILGKNYTVKDQFEQNEAFFKIMRLEKWMGFAITSLMLILMAFNTVGALWMIVLDKQQDVSVLKSLGASDKLVYRIFLLEGLLLTGLGLLIGMALALLLYFLQKEIGIIRIPEGFLVESYPIALRASDFIPVMLTVMGIGFLASIAPAYRAKRVAAYLREE